MQGFDLDPRLRADCDLLSENDDCSYLLHRNAAVDWLIAVPHTSLTELYQLPADLQRSVCADINRMSLSTRSMSPPSVTWWRNCISMSSGAAGTIPTGPNRCGAGPRWLPAAMNAPSLESGRTGSHFAVKRAGMANKVY